jgi:hypothetical protein
MALWVPPQGLVGYVTSNVSGVRPTSDFGTDITPGTSNSFGSYTSILSGGSITQDCTGIYICINNTFVSGQARDLLVTIGKDDTGGTSYTAFINNLCAPSACNYLEQVGGIWYYFPVKIKNGTQLAAKASVNNGTASTVAVAVYLVGGESTPTNYPSGQFTETIGANTAASTGTSVTVGTTSMGSWTSIGTTQSNLWAFDFGIGFNSSTFAPCTIWDFAVGDGTTFRILGQGIRHLSKTGVGSSKMSFSTRITGVQSGSVLYARGQSSNATTGNFSACAYGVGG